MAPPLERNKNVAQAELDLDSVVVAVAITIEIAAVATSDEAIVGTQKETPHIDRAGLLDMLE